MTKLVTKHTEYLDSFLNCKRRKAYLKAAMKTLSRYDYDAIAFSGNSGAMIGGALAAMTGKVSVLVRKSRENAHSDLSVEGYFPALGVEAKYIIVDDFVYTGDTVNRIVNKIQSMYPQMECVGFLEFDRSRRTTKRAISPGAIPNLLPARRTHG